MHPVRALAKHPLTGQSIRYVVAGGTVALVYLSLPLVFHADFGVAIQIAIPIAYVLAVSLHFQLQRHFVFRHVTEFALSRRKQIARYVALGLVQYPTAALSTALLPSVLGFSEQAAFVCTSLAISATFFLLLRGHVFHPNEEPENPSADPADLILGHGLTPGGGDRAEAEAASSGR
jgi:putative flippase GtrA